MRANVDTDLIIRIERLTGTPRESLGAFCFEALRFRADGSEDPACVLNRPAFRQAPILLAGPNFGCGSSREGAVWALIGAGIRCVIAESFGEIFEANSFRNGLLPVALPREVVAALAQAASAGAALTVDLVARQVRTPSGEPTGFTVPPLRRAALLEGVDELAQALKRDPEVAAWQMRDRKARPWIWLGEEG
nr:3-isopropylmalate dehydratase small subunit [Neoroseomonas alba]